MRKQHNSMPNPGPDRERLLAALRDMPEEAFGWFVVWAQQGYPSGLGGFRPDSRTSIKALQRAAKRYFEEYSKEHP